MSVETLVIVAMVFVLGIAVWGLLEGLLYLTSNKTGRKKNKRRSPH